MSDDSARTMAPPSHLLEGRYLAEKGLAVGRISEVFAGSDTWSNESVTIRILRADRLEMRDSFERMRERLFGLASPRIVRAIHIGEDRDGRPFLVTERLVGRGLEAVGTVRWEVACEVGRQAAEVVAEMHLNGLHHGALEKSSFFVAASNAGGSRVKLLDLGTGKGRTTAAADVRALAEILVHLLKGDAKAAPAELFDKHLPRWLAPSENNVTAAQMAAELKGLVDAAADSPAAHRRVAGPRVLPKSSVIVFDDRDDGG